MLYKFNDSMSFISLGFKIPFNTSIFFFLTVHGIIKFKKRKKKTIIENN